MKITIGPYVDDGDRNISINLDDYDMWNLDHTLALIILPCLKKFKKNLHGHPGNITFEQWKSILNKMIKAFELLNGDEFYYKNKEDEMIKEGLELFAKYYRHLWD